MSKDTLLASQEIENRMLTMRGVLVMLDSDLALMFQSESKYTNRAP